MDILDLYRRHRPQTTTDYSLGSITINPASLRRKGISIPKRTDTMTDTENDSFTVNKYDQQTHASRQALQIVKKAKVPWYHKFK